MDEYIFVKDSQIDLYRDIPLFFETEEKEYRLYKKEEAPFLKSRVSDQKHPRLFILKKDKQKAVKELQAALNIDFAKSILHKGLDSVKATLGQIIEEAMEEPSSEAFDALPETIEIFFTGYAGNPDLLESISMISSSSLIMVDHSINVLALVMRFCICNGFNESDLKKIALAAFLHDIGSSGIDRSILESNTKLTDAEFEELKTHTEKGHDIIKKYSAFDPLVASVALKHHERIDGSGYPARVREICFESQLIGLIDCYEPLTYRDKSFRRVKKPFESLQLIKQEVLEGKFDKNIFKSVCSCMTH